MVKSKKTDDNKKSECEDNIDQTEDKYKQLNVELSDLDKASEEETENDNGFSDSQHKATRDAGAISGLGGRVSTIASSISACRISSVRTWHLIVLKMSDDFMSHC